MRTRTNYISNYRNMKDDFGILPIPKYDEKQERYITNCGVGEIAVLPRSYDESRLDNVGILLEALAYDTNKSIIPEYKEVLLKTKYARDNESEDMIDIVIDSVSFEFGLNAWQDTVANPLVKNIFVARNPSVASTLASMQKSVNAQIEKLVEKLEQ